MMRDAVVEVIFVHVRIHPAAVLQKHLVVFRTGQRREEEELEDIERQFALDDLDVAKDRLFGVRGKAKNIAGKGDGAELEHFMERCPDRAESEMTVVGCYRAV